jgi:hypothetical protein
MKRRVAEWLKPIFEWFRPVWSRIDRLFPARMGMLAKIGVIFVLLILFTLTTPALAAWSDRHLLPFLSSMNIFALVENLSGITDQMVTDTAGLEQEVELAGKKMAALDQQEKLVASQLNTHKGIQQELQRQLNGNINAREWMKQILSREKHTYALTGQVSSLAGTISGQMSETINHLKNVSGGMVAIAQNTRKMNGQMDSLLNELDQSIQNFHFISRITDALRFLKSKTGLDLPLPRGDSGSSPSSPLPGGSLPKPPVSLPDLTNPLNPKPKSGNDSSGLLDLLLP